MNWFKNLVAGKELNDMKTKLDFTEGRLERSEGRLDYLKRDRDEWSSLAANRKDELKVSSDSLGAFKAENEALQDRAQFLETANKSLCQGLDEGKERESKLSNQLLQARDELAEAQTTMRARRPMPRSAGLIPQAESEQYREERNNFAKNILRLQAENEAFLAKIGELEAVRDAARQTGDYFQFRNWELQRVADRLIVDLQEATKNDVRDPATGRFVKRAPSARGNRGTGRSAKAGK